MYIYATFCRVLLFVDVKLTMNLLAWEYFNGYIVGALSDRNRHSRSCHKPVTVLTLLTPRFDDFQQCKTFFSK